MNKPKYIVVHHSVSPRDASITGTEASINKSHKARGFNLSELGYYVGYQYMIFGTGEVRQYRKDTEMGCHVKEDNKNFDSIGICMIGDFSEGTGRRNEYPSQAQLIALTTLCRDLQAKYNIPDANIHPHRYYALGPSGKPYKDCWGNKLPDNPVELFVDVEKPYWQESMDWCVTHGIIEKPKDPTLIVTWAEHVTTLHRLALKMKEWFVQS